jgi:deoxyribodipyrimidine photo-lyase
MIYETSIFIFTRDLRLYDNTTLLQANKESKKILPIFIFNPEQISESNKYKSSNCVQFMCECLDELNEELKKLDSKLHYFYDKPQTVIEYLLDNYNFDAVYINTDYTPFAQKRNNTIEKICKKYDVAFHSKEDYMLTNKDIVTNKSGNQYVKFTPYYEEASKIPVALPNSTTIKKFVNKKIKIEFKENIHNFYEKNENIAVHGGRKNALKILKKIEDFNEYNETRNYPSTSTTFLSAYLKFNVVSIREVYSAIKKNLDKNNELIKQLYWRDFYMMLLYHHPHILGSAMKPNFNNINWSYDKKHFKMWCEGKTGFPLVDAGMRQLNQTGFMHNRCRMVVADFLVKLLRIDWRWGEKYFATQLVDYDPANNNGGWSWCASTNITSQDWFTCFNPMIQSKKYDKDCEYIKKWVPELKDVKPNDIHKCDIAKYKIDYPKPIVDYVKAKNEGLEMYKKVL